MPFVSKSQRRKCYAAQASNPTTTWNCSEWEDATPKSIPLPEKVPDKEASLLQTLFELQQSQASLGAGTTPSTTRVSEPKSLAQQAIKAATLMQISPARGVSETDVEVIKQALLGNGGMGGLAGMFSPLRGGGKPILPTAKPLNPSAVGNGNSVPSVSPALPAGQVNFAPGPNGRVAKPLRLKRTQPAHTNIVMPGFQGPGPLPALGKRSETQIHPAPRESIGDIGHPYIPASQNPLLDLLSHLHHIDGKRASVTPAEGLKDVPQSLALTYTPQPSTTEARTPSTPSEPNIKLSSLLRLFPGQPGNSALGDNQRRAHQATFFVPEASLAPGGHQATPSIHCLTRIHIPSPEALGDRKLLPTMKQASAGAITSDVENLVAPERIVRLYHYECPNCGSTNAFNGNPQAKMAFRGSGKCYDCDHSWSIVGRKQQSVKDGPVIAILPEDHPALKKEASAGAISDASSHTLGRGCMVQPSCNLAALQKAALQKAASAGAISDPSTEAATGRELSRFCHIHMSPPGGTLQRAAEFAPREICAPSLEGNQGHDLFSVSLREKCAPSAEKSATSDRGGLEALFTELYRLKTSATVSGDGQHSRSLAAQPSEPTPSTEDFGDDNQAGSKQAGAASKLMARIANPGVAGSALAAESRVLARTGYNGVSPSLIRKMETLRASKPLPAQPSAVPPPGAPPSIAPAKVQAMRQPAHEATLAQADRVATSGRHGAPQVIQPQEAVGVGSNPAVAWKGTTAAPTSLHSAPAELKPGAPMWWSGHSDVAAGYAKPLTGVAPGQASYLMKAPVEKLRSFGTASPSFTPHVGVDSRRVAPSLDRLVGTSTDWAKRPAYEGVFTVPNKGTLANMSESVYKGLPSGRGFQQVGGSQMGRSAPAAPERFSAPGLKPWVQPPKPKPARVNLGDDMLGAPSGVAKPKPLGLSTPLGAGPKPLGSSPAPLGTLKAAALGGSDLDALLFKLYQLKTSAMVNGDSSAQAYLAAQPSEPTPSAGGESVTIGPKIPRHSSLFKTAALPVAKLLGSETDDLLRGVAGTAGSTAKALVAPTAGVTKGTAPASLNRFLPSAGGKPATPSLASPAPATPSPAAQGTPATFPRADPNAATATVKPPAAPGIPATPHPALPPQAPVPSATPRPSPTPTAPGTQATGTASATPKAPNWWSRTFSDPARNIAQTKSISQAVAERAGANASPWRYVQEGAARAVENAGSFGIPFVTNTLGQGIKQLGKIPGLGGIAPRLGNTVSGAGYVASAPLRLATGAGYLARPVANLIRQKPTNIFGAQSGHTLRYGADVAAPLGLGVGVGGAGMVARYSGLDPLGVREAWKNKNPGQDMPTGMDAVQSDVQKYFTEPNQKLLGAISRADIPAAWQRTQEMAGQATEAVRRVGPKIWGASEAANVETAGRPDEVKVEEKIKPPAPGVTGDAGSGGLAAVNPQLPGPVGDAVGANAPGEVSLAQTTDSIKQLSLQLAGMSDPNNPSFSSQQAMQAKGELEQLKAQYQQQLQSLPPDRQAKHVLSTPLAQGERDAAIKELGAQRSVIQAGAANPALVQEIKAYDQARQAGQAQEGQGPGLESSLSPAAQEFLKAREGLSNTAPKLAIDNFRNFGMGDTPEEMMAWANGRDVNDPLNAVALQQLKEPSAPGTGATIKTSPQSMLQQFADMPPMAKIIALSGIGIGLGAFLAGSPIVGTLGLLGGLAALGAGGGLGSTVGSLFGRKPSAGGISDNGFGNSLTPEQASQHPSFQRLASGAQPDANDIAFLAKLDPRAVDQLLASNPNMTPVMAQALKLRANTARNLVGAQRTALGEAKAQQVAQLKAQEVAAQPGLQAKAQAMGIQGDPTNPQVLGQFLAQHRGNPGALKVKIDTLAPQEKAILANKIQEGLQQAEQQHGKFLARHNQGYKDFQSVLQMLQQ